MVDLYTENYGMFYLKLRDGRECMTPVQREGKEASIRWEHGEWVPYYFHGVSKDGLGHLDVVEAKQLTDDEEKIYFDRGIAVDMYSARRNNEQNSNR